MNIQEKYSFVTENDYQSVAGPDWPSYTSFVNHVDVPEFVYQEIDAMLAPQQNFEHPSFCILPFYGYEYPKDTFCCLVPDGTDRSKIKQQMLDGLRPSACQKCWNLEDIGVKSDRLIKNETLDFYLDNNIKDLYNDCLADRSSIIHYKIDTNNVCNAACVTCDSQASSAWAKLEKANNKKSYPIYQLGNKDVDKVINYATAKSIVFRGGESFLSKTNFYILEQLLQHQNRDCFISFVTNGSFDQSDPRLNLIKQFSNVNFCFSIDGVDSVFDYLRWPLKFDKTQQNIDYCKNNNIDVSVSYTLSNLNILYHNQTTDWFKQNNLPYIVNPVYEPKHFRPGALPRTLKQSICADLDSTAASLIQHHDSNDDLDFQQFKQEILKQDSWKNIKLKHYLPELAELIDQ